MVRDVNREYDLPLFTVPARKFLTVSELNELIKGTLESQLDAIWVQGEISNFRVPPSGHYYFTLKDDKNQISAVMFRRQGMGLRFMPENGMAVLCLGRVSLYSVRGDLQLYVDDMEAQGQGALFLAFEQLKKKLAAEGLFATERKKPLPRIAALRCTTCCEFSAIAILNGAW
jgi:exodeoxyribonuclease VII large subunit